MQKEHLPIYQIQDFQAEAQKEQYFYFNSFADHLQQHLFVREPHKHSFYIILLVTQGSGTHTIDFEEYAVKPGSVFFLMPGQVHSWQLSTDADGYVIFFTKAFYAKEYPDGKLTDFPFFHALLHKPLLHISQAEKASLMPTLNMLREEYGQAKLRKNIMLSRHLDIPLIQLTRIFEDRGTETTAQGKEYVLLQNLESLIDEHYKAHVPVSFYADKLHVTTKKLNETCKRAVGKTTNELIQERSLLEGKRLLTHSTMTASQIAAELGYSDTTYFFRFFKNSRAAPRNNLEDLLFDAFKSGAWRR